MFYGGNLSKEINRSNGILFDFDDTLAELNRFLLKQRDYSFGGKKLLYENLTHHFWEQIPGYDHVSLEENVKGINDLLLQSELHRTLQPSYGMVELLRFFHDKEYVMSLGTARDPQLEVNTIEYLDTHYTTIDKSPLITSHHFGRGSEDKLALCKDLAITVAFDDSPSNIQKFIDNQIHTFVPHRPYNRQFLKEHKDNPYVMGYDKGSEIIEMYNNQLY